MRTTIRIDDQLLREAKELAARTDRTLTAVVEDALRLSLRQARERGGRDVELPAFKGRRGLQPGVDLDDSAALLDLMESDRRSP